MVATGQFCIIGYDPTADAPLWWKIVLAAEQQALDQKEWDRFVAKLRSCSTWFPLRVANTTDETIKNWLRWAHNDDDKGAHLMKSLVINGKLEADDPAA